MECDGQRKAERDRRAQEGGGGDEGRGGVGACGSLQEGGCLGQQDDQVDMCHVSSP